MRIVALDPGGTTGWAQYDTEEDDWETFELDLDNHHLTLVDKLQLAWPNVIVYERFVLGPRDPNYKLIPVEYIGCIKYFAQLHALDDPSVSLVVQSAHIAKEFWTDDKLHQLDLWDSSPHIRDAIRHLLYYVTFTLRDRRWLNELAL